jgi:site-specific DNA-methyltransferase (adenine-specific)
MHAYELVPVDSLALGPTRQRKDIPESHITELAESIAESGLLHAPIVDNNRTLIAGDCRRRALRLLSAQGRSFFYNGEEVSPGLCPVIITHLTDPASLFRIELEENLRRKNLSPIDQASAIARLHELLRGAKPVQTNIDTARELAALQNRPPASVNGSQVADALLIDQFKDDPAVKAARTINQAARIAKKKMEQEFLSAVGASYTQTSSERHKFINGSAFTVLPELDPGTFDVILTDPPYGVDAHTFGSASFLNESHGYEDTKENALAAYRLLAETGYFLCADEAHLFAFCDIRFFGELELIFSLAGWNVWPTPIVWSKGSTAHAPRPEHGPKRSYETILFASKGDKKTQKLGMDVIECQAVHSSKRLHPAEKPVALLEELLSWTIVPGSRVLDPFCGSGGVAIAADEMGCDSVSIELDPATLNLAKARFGERNNA